MKKLENWLSWLPNVTQVTQVKVKIAGKLYAGAKYTQNLKYLAGMDAIVRGEKTENDSYQVVAFCLLGIRPKKIKGRARFCFQFGDETWHIAGWYEGPPTEYHPLGSHFLLKKWESKEPIDYYKEKPYLRVPIQVEETLCEPANSTAAAGPA